MLGKSVLKVSKHWKTPCTSDHLQARIFGPTSKAWNVLPAIAFGDGWLTPKLPMFRKVLNCSAWSAVIKVNLHHLFCKPFCKKDKRDTEYLLSPHSRRRIRFQPDGKDADIGWIYARDAGGLAEGFGQDFLELFARLKP